jgi:hypothetical protein
MRWSNYLMDKEYQQTLGLEKQRQKHNLAAIEARGRENLAAIEARARENLRVEKDMFERRQAAEQEQRQRREQMYGDITEQTLGTRYEGITTSHELQTVVGMHKLREANLDEQQAREVAERTVPAMMKVLEAEDPVAAEALKPTIENMDPIMAYEMLKPRMEKIEAAAAELAGLKAAYPSLWDRLSKRLKGMSKAKQFAIFNKTIERYNTEEAREDRLMKDYNTRLDKWKKLRTEWESSSYSSGEFPIEKPLDPYESGRFAPAHSAERALDRLSTDDRRQLIYDYEKETGDLLESTPEDVERLYRWAKRNNRI